MVTTYSFSVFDIVVNYKSEPVNPSMCKEKIQLAFAKMIEEKDLKTNFLELQIRN